MRIYSTGEVTKFIKIQKELFKDQRAVGSLRSPEPSLEAAGITGWETGAEVSFLAATTSVSLHEASESGPGAAVGQRAGSREYWMCNKKEQGRTGIHWHPCLYFMASKLQRCSEHGGFTSASKGHASSRLPTSNPEPHRKGILKKVASSPSLP